MVYQRLKYHRRGERLCRMYSLSPHRQIICRALQIDFIIKFVWKRIVIHNPVIIISDQTGWWLPLNRVFFWNMIFALFFKFQFLSAVAGCIYAHVLHTRIFITSYWQIRHTFSHDVIIQYWLRNHSCSEIKKKKKIAYLRTRTDLLPSTHTTLFWHPCDVVLTLWMLYGHRNDVVCLRG